MHITLRETLTRKTTLVIFSIDPTPLEINILQNETGIAMSTHLLLSRQPSLVLEFHSQNGKHL